MICSLLVSLRGIKRRDYLIISSFKRRNKKNSPKSTVYERFSYIFPTKRVSFASSYHTITKFLFFKIFPALLQLFDRHFLYSLKITYFNKPNYIITHNCDNINFSLIRIFLRFASAIICLWKKVFNTINILYLYIGLFEKFVQFLW